MTIQKAIQIINDYLNLDTVINENDFRDALALSLSALRHVNKYRASGNRISQLLLEGED